MLKYGVKAVFVGGASPYSTAYEQLSMQSLQNVISTNIGLAYPRSDLMGWDGAGNQEQVDRPRVQLTFTYLPVSGYNENNIGFVVGGFAPALYNLNTERNFYISANTLHQDAFTYTGLPTYVMAFGNCALTHYDFAAAVGQITMANATVEALNFLIQTGATGQILPAIVKSTAAAVTGVYTLPQPLKAVGNFTEVQPGSIQLTFDTGSAIGLVLSGNNSCPVQTFKFSMDFPRQSVRSLGSAYPSTRSTIWPITISIQADVILNKLQVDSLNRFNCADSGYNFNVQFKNSCTTTDLYGFQFVGAKLNTQSVSAQVGNSDIASFNWTLKINDINRAGSGLPNFLITSQLPQAYTGIIFPQVLATTGFGPLVLNLGTGCYLSVVQGVAMLSGNSAFFPDKADTATIRATVSGNTTEYQDIKATIF